jgi:biotin operon repressor
VKALKVDKRASSHEGLGALDLAYIHLTAKRHTTETLARAMGVSIATAFRLVKTLRRGGVRIQSRKEGRAWFFAVLEDEEIEAAWDKDPLLDLVGIVKGPGRRGESVNDAVYGRK